MKRQSKGPILKSFENEGTDFNMKELVRAIVKIYILIIVYQQFSYLPVTNLSWLLFNSHLYSM